MLIASVPASQPHITTASCTPSASYLSQLNCSQSITYLSQQKLKLHLTLRQQRTGLRFTPSACENSPALGGLLHISYCAASSHHSSIPGKPAPSTLQSLPWTRSHLTFSPREEAPYRLLTELVRPSRNHRTCTVRCGPRMPSEIVQSLSVERLR